MNQTVRQPLRLVVSDYLILILAGVLYGCALKYLCCPHR